MPFILQNTHKKKKRIKKKSTGITLYDAHQSVKMLCWPVLHSIGKLDLMNALNKKNIQFFTVDERTQMFQVCAWNTVMEKVIRQPKLI